jgi:hypothetical protein
MLSGAKNFNLQNYEIFFKIKFFSNQLSKTITVLLYTLKPLAYIKIPFQNFVKFLVIIVHLSATVFFL